MSLPKIGLAVFIWKDGKFLMGQRQGAHGEGTWSVPGGHLELNESWETCAKRETLEETGLKIKNTRFLAVTNDIMPKDKKHYITIWMQADWASGEPTILEPDKYISQQWCNFENLPTPLFQPCWQNLRKTQSQLFKK